MRRKSLLILSLLMVVVMVILTACSGSNSKDTAGENSTGSNNTPEETATDSNEETATDSDGREMVGNMYVTGLPIVKEKVTLTVAWPRSPYSDISAAEKQAVKDAEEATNVALNFMEIESAGWNEKINIMIASQELPDVIMGSVPDLANNLEVFHDLTPYIEKYAPSLMKVFEEYPSVRVKMTQADGSIRTLLTYQMLKYDEMTGGTLYWIKQGWLDTLGLDMPTNTDELFEVLKAFKEKDPNKNNEQDEIPLSFCNNDWAGKLSNLFGPFGVLEPDNHILVEDGKVVFQPTKEGFYNALVYLNKLYKNGLLDAEGFSQTTAQRDAKMSQNNIGVVAVYDPTNKIGKGHDYVPLPPIAGPDGTILHPGSTDPNPSQNVAIPITCKTPEVVVRYYDYVNSDMKTKLSWNYGPEGLLWKLQDDGSWYQLEDNLKEDQVWDRARYVYGFGPNCFAFFDVEECKKIIDRFVQARADAVDQLIKYFPKETYNALPDPPEIAAEKNLIKTELDAYISSFIAKSVMEGIDKDAWEKHLAECKRLQVDRYVELMQYSYDRFNEAMEKLK